MTTEDKKRRHHYVWRHYLTAWADENGQVWCQRRGTRFRAATTNIAVRKDFYRLKEMTESDLRWVEQLIIEPMPEPRRSLARGWVPMFRDVFTLRALAASRGLADERFDEELEIMISNLEENLHSRIEEAALALLDALKRGDATPLRDDGTYSDFAQFIGLQYMRTPGIAARSIEAAGFISNFNVDAAWGLMRTIFATNIGEQVFMTRRSTNLSFLEPGPTSRFIAGDQPIVNLGKTERLELYYPLSPSRALKLTPDHDRPEVNSYKLSDAETQAYNKRIMDASDEQLYADVETALISASE